jgi:ferredoxin--NADP+ reductase/benzoyl-CoA 2,3-dioxygenase component A
MLKDDNTHIYVCGLKGMEDGVLQALREIGEQHQLDWDALWMKLKREGRLHLETY